MYLFLCKLWPYLFGGLISWLFSGWFARRLKHGEPPVEKIVEKEVTVETLYDNPDLVSKVASLEKENLLIADLQSKLSFFESTEPEIIEKTIEVEKLVDNPEHLNKIRALEEGNRVLQAENKKMAGLQATITQLENRKPEIVEKKIEVEKRVDNPEHLKKIQALEAGNKTLQADIQKMAGLQATITQLENRKPEIVEKKVEVEKWVDNPEHLKKIQALEAGNKTLQADIQKMAGLQATITQLENRKPEIVEKKVEVEKRVDNPEHISRISDLETQLKRLERTQKIDIKAGKKAGIAIKAEDDFTAIEGIGPKISELIHKAGIRSFKELSETNPEEIQKILSKAGSNFQTANPGTWSDQANLVVNNRWPALKALQDILDGGVYPDGSSSGGNHQSARVKALEAELAEYKKAATKTPKPVDYVAAKAAGFKIRGKGNKHDFTVIEGIGPKINDLIHKAEIHTYSALAVTSTADIRKILDDAGSSFALAKPDTWPSQSDMASNNHWEKLMQWQDEFDVNKE